MEDFNHPNPKVHYHFRIIKFLLPLILLPLLFQFFKPFLTQLFTDTIGKSYMFLLCNGLLVFIAMNSGLIHAPSPSTHQSIEEAAVDINYERSSQLEEFHVSEIAAAPLAVADENVMKIESPEEKEESLVIIEQENVISDAQDDEDEGNSLVIVDEDEHGVEDTEELNQKCEDFIQKMKATFCSEPRADYTNYFDNQKAMVAVY